MDMRFNGRSIRPGEMGRAIAGAMEDHMQGALRGIRSELEALRCAEHAECRVKVENTREGFELRGSSCPEFKQLVEATFAASGARRTNDGNL